MAQVAGAQPPAAPPPPTPAGVRVPQRPHQPYHVSAHNRHRQQPQHQQHQQRHLQHRPNAAGALPPGAKQRQQSHRRPPSHYHAAAPAPAPAPAGPVPAIAADGSAELERLRRDTPFICNIRFRNDLPEIPADPKLLVSRYEPDRLSRFFLTSIEQQPRRELLLPADVGVPISLVDLERYDVPEASRQGLDPADEALLQEVDNLPSMGQNASPLKVKRATKGQVSWLMATTYLASHDPSSKRFGGQPNSRFQMKEQQQELTREQQLADIEATFEAAARRPRHPTKRNVTAVSSIPVLPDTSCWEDKYVTVSFEDGDPAQDSRTLAQVKDPAVRQQLISHCMIKSYQPHGGSAEPAMGLLVPRSTAAAAARGEGLPEGADVHELEGEYTWDCEYSFDLIQKPEGRHDRDPDNLLLVIHDGHVGYCLLDGQVKLRKRKRQEGDEPRPENAIIRHREFREQEINERAQRLAELEAEVEMGYEEQEQEDEQEDEQLIEDDIF